MKACDSSALSEQSQALLICAEASQQESINSQQNPEESQLCVNVYKRALQTVKSEKQWENVKHARRDFETKALRKETICEDQPILHNFVQQKVFPIDLSDALKKLPDVKRKDVEPDTCAGVR